MPYHSKDGTDSVKKGVLGVILDTAVALDEVV
jgi:hypothetical protein